LKIICNNSNIVDLLGNFLSFPSIKINSDSYFDFKYFSERMNENKYKDVLKIREECVLLDKLN